MRVDFMIIGAQKCGTTSLAAQLAEHPSICFCEIKEPGYFHKAEDWRAKVEAYHQLFAPEEGQICGEASTMYTFLPEFQGTSSRLYEYNPDLKLIYIMRQPVERVVSNYSHDLVRGFVKAPPENVVFEDPGYLNRSRYAVQIRPYLDLFPRQNILLLAFEDYVADQLRTLRLISSFLAIPAAPFDGIGSVQAHKSVGELRLKYPAVRALVKSEFFQTLRPYIPSSIRQPVRRGFSNQLEGRPFFSPALKRMLWRFLEDDVVAIEELMERRLDVWRLGDAA